MALRQRHLWRRHAVCQVHCRYTGGQPKPGTPLPVTRTTGGGIYRQDQRLVPGGFRTLHQRAGEAPVGLDVELEPQRATQRVCHDGLCHMFQRHTGLGAQNQARTLGRCSVGRGQFTVGVCHPLKSDGGQQDRVFQRAPQQRGAGAGPRHAAQHAGMELQGVPRAAVGAQGDFVARAAAEIGPGVCIQVGVGVVGVVFQGDDVRRKFLHLQNRRSGHKSADEKCPMAL